MYLVSTNKTVDGFTGYYVKSFYHLQRQLGHHIDSLDEHLGIMGHYKKAVNVEEDDFGHIQAEVVYTDMYGDIDVAVFYLLKIRMLGTGE